MILGDNLFVMLLVEKFFSTFTNKAHHRHQQVHRSADLRRLQQPRAGGLRWSPRHAPPARKVPREPQDHGFMYSHGYEDLDGHTWELIHMTGEPPKQ